MDTVLFACLHNAGRSQMAAAFFNDACDPQKASAISAGTQPGDRVHPEVVQVMKEQGIDLTGEKPKLLSSELAQQATLLITMGCGDACPIYPGKKYEDWVLDDPAGQDIETVRRIRDEIDKRVRRLITELLADRSPAFD